MPDGPPGGLFQNDSKFLFFYCNSNEGLANNHVFLE